MRNCEAAQSSSLQAMRQVHIPIICHLPDVYANISQMYPKNGPPLPLDYQLRLPHHIPSLPALRPVRRNQHVHPNLPPPHPHPRTLGKPQSPRLPRPSRLGHGPPLRPRTHQQHNPLRALHPPRAVHIQSRYKHNHDRELGDRTT